MEFFILFLACTAVSSLEACLMNCYCNQYMAECYLNTCGDDLSTEYDVLRIHGKLCEQHRYILTHIVQSSENILYDDTCGDIQNCQ